MDDRLQHKTNKEISAGSPERLGATLTEDGVNFALYSQHARAVFLLLFDAASDDPTDVIRIEHTTDHVWHVFIRGLTPGQLYGYALAGEYEPGQGKRFNPHKLYIDPYAKAINGKFRNQDNLIFAYDTSAEDTDLVMDTRYNHHCVPRSIVVDDAFDWQGDVSPQVQMNELIIYEAHLKGFSAHPTSGVEHPGTYLGFIEKIPYLKELGINAVELLPVQEFFIRSELLDAGLTDFWGYNTIGFFAPESSYSTQSRPGVQVEEFKTLVRALHSAGIEVILDVVYNHTGEGSELGPTLCFKGIDNQTYYSLIADPDNQDEPARYYLNDTGCGNTFNIESQAVMRLVLDSLRYWVESMHVDGFRFDLASILARVKGEFSEQSEFFKAVSEDPVLSRVKMIAEPWDLTTYQVGNFPKGWSEWNGKFRDTARRFLKGEESQAAEMAKRLTGSADLYQDDGRHPYTSINFITCHDGFTLHDLYAYNKKHNEANQEDNRDGSDDNHSWNCGAEGPTDDAKILALRAQMIKNALCAVVFSLGTPMILYGDEISRTQHGNNNAYCQDNELTWFDWSTLEKNAPMLDFCKKAIIFRKRYPIVRHKHFFTGETEKEDSVPDLSWFARHLSSPHWESPKLKTLAYMLSGTQAPSEAGDYYLFLVFHMHPRGITIDLPRHAGFSWFHAVDTAAKAGDDFRALGEEPVLRDQEKCHCKAYSVNVFVAKK
jgi:isoamylase